MGIDWRLIETAPEDTHVLVYRPKAPPSRRYGVDVLDRREGGKLQWWSTRRDEQPSHWAPPHPPTPSKEHGDE